MVAKNLFGARQTNGAATVAAGVTTNTSTSVAIAPANKQRIFFEFNNNDSNQGVFLKLQDVGVDDIQKGIFVPAKSSWQMPPQAIYTGPISAIADTDSPVVYHTEY